VTDAASSRPQPLPSAAVDTSRRTLLGSSLVIAGLIGLAALIVVAVVLLGGGDDPEPEVTAPPEEAPEPEPPEEPEPEPPEPVEGEAELLGIRDLSISGTQLVHPGSGDDAPVEIDEGEAETLMEDLVSWLDEHLTQLQDGHGGLVAEAGLTGPDGVGDLAGPADLVDEASYAFVIGVRGEPEWAEVLVEVTREDGSSRAARMVFDPGRELMAVQGLDE
jgi:hypothetical protein